MLHNNRDGHWAVGVYRYCTVGMSSTDGVQSGFYDIDRRIERDNILLTSSDFTARRNEISLTIPIPIIQFTPTLCVPVDGPGSGCGTGQGVGGGIRPGVWLCLHY